jgi:hypothetical protein
VEQEEKRSGKNAMTEQEWLESHNPLQMLNSIRGRVSNNVEFNLHLRLSSADRTPPDFARGKFSDRKARLCAVAACRTLWTQMTELASRNAVEVSESFADEQASNSDLHAAGKKLDAATRSKLRAKARYPALWAGAWDAARSAVRIGDWDSAVLCHFAAQGGVGSSSSNNANLRLCHLLRDIFGNPFHPVTIDSRWLTSTVSELADAIYAERAFDRMSILADALMDAGCDSDEIIQHCRGPGPHVRGCWIVDLLLGKE